MLEDVRPENALPPPKPAMDETGLPSSESADAAPQPDTSSAPAPPLWPVDSGHQPAEAEFPPETPESDNAATLEEEEILPAAAPEADWKAALRRDFEQWLADLDDATELEDLTESDDPGTEADETPDLYSFYAQLAAANTEFRKANRRTAEAINQWCETLTRFDSSLSPLRETMAKLVAAQPKADELSRSHCLVLVEWLDRLNRIRKAFESPPRRTSWWRGGGEAAWLKAWEAQRQALAILASHVEELLKKEGVTRLDALGQPFDAAVMTAVAVQPDGTHPPQTVLEELAAGYRRHGELLRTAQVKVSRQL